MTIPRGNIVLSTFLFPFPVWTFFLFADMKPSIMIAPRPEKKILYCIENEDCIFMTISWPFWYSINVQTSKIVFDIKLNVMKSTASHILSHVVHWSSNTSYCTLQYHSLHCTFFIYLFFFYENAWIFLFSFSVYETNV